MYNVFFVLILYVGGGNIYGRVRAVSIDMPKYKVRVGIGSWLQSYG